MCSEETGKLRGTGNRSPANSAKSRMVSGGPSAAASNLPPLKKKSRTNTQLCCSFADPITFAQYRQREGLNPDADIWAPGLNILWYAVGKGLERRGHFCLDIDLQYYRLAAKNDSVTDNKTN